MTRIEIIKSHYDAVRKEVVAEFLRIRPSPHIDRTAYGKWLNDVDHAVQQTFTDQNREIMAWTI